MVGASFDSVEENRDFREKYAFPFTLLSDPDHALAVAYGAAGDAGEMHAARITVVVDPDGKVVRVYPKVDPDTHPQLVLADLD